MHGHLRAFVDGTSAHAAIRRAAAHLHAHLVDSLSIDALATAAGMSRSAFYASFRQLTSQSPLQYQKRLRQLRSRQLLQSGTETAEGAAYRVSYRSPSHCSDYTRYFGHPLSSPRPRRSHEPPASP